jgi:hypothetical protein
VSGTWNPYEDAEFITKYTFVSKTKSVMYCKIFNINVPYNDLAISNNKFILYENKILIDSKVCYEYKIYLNQLLYIHLILDKRFFFLKGLGGYYEIEPNEKDRSYDWKMMKLKETKAYQNYLKYGRK